MNGTVFTIVCDMKLLNIYDTEYIMVNKPYLFGNQTIIYI